MLGVREIHDGRVDGRNRGSGSLVAAVQGSLVDVIRGWVRGDSHVGRRSRLGSREARASHDQVSQLGNRDSLSWVEFKDTLQDRVELSRDGQNGPEELGVLHVGAECAILERGSLPWVASTGQVDKHDSEAPDVIGC